MEKREDFLCVPAVVWVPENTETISLTVGVKKENGLLITYNCALSPDETKKAIDDADKNYCDENGWLYVARDPKREYIDGVVDNIRKDDRN